MNRRVKLFTFGCKVNQYETQAIREQFLSAGYKEDADETTDIYPVRSLATSRKVTASNGVYIINTCTVTARAHRQCLRLIRKLQHNNPRSRIIVTGCLVEKNAGDILQISDKIQIVPNQLKHRVIDFLNSTCYVPCATCEKVFTPLTISAFKDHERAFVKIQDGCSNFCSYCKVPLVRGKSRSRNSSEIIEEVRRLINCGFKEIVLTGICLGDYHYRNFDLADVLLYLEKIEGKFRLRLSSIEPQLVSDKLLEVLNSPKVCAHLHIPLQSGDNTILKRMNRRYTQEGYLSLVARVKKKVKDLSLTTDILVGFPGEKEVNFRNTLHCLKEVLPLRTHIFPFSPRWGTEAFDLQGRLQPQSIKERVGLVRKVAAQCSYKFRKRFLARQLTVLIESQPDKQTGSLCGYSENYIRVKVENATGEDINKLVQVKVEAVDMCSTRAQRLGRGVARVRLRSAARENTDNISFFCCNRGPFPNKELGKSIL